MPRATRSGSTVAASGLALRGNNTQKLGQGKNENVGAKKRKMDVAGENGKNVQAGKPATKRRAALGEITNVSNTVTTDIL